MIATDPLNDVLSAMSEAEIVAYFEQCGFIQASRPTAKLTNYLPFLVLVHIAAGSASRGKK